MYRNQKHMDTLVICFFDLICALLSSFFVLHMPYNEMTSANLVIFLLAHMIAFFVSNISHHMVSRGKLDEAIAVMNYNVHYFVILCITFFFSKGIFTIGRRALVVFFVINYIMIYISHYFIKLYHKKYYSKRISTNKVYLITTEDRVRNILYRMNEFGARGTEVNAIALLGANRVGEQIGGIDVVANEDNYLEYATYNVVDEVFFNLPDDYNINMPEMIDVFETMGAAVSVNINAYDLPIASNKIFRKICGCNVLTFTTKIYDVHTLMIKRAMDIAGSIVGLLITGVITIFLAPIIKLESKGPVVFSQERVGKNGRVFKIYKFRSMFIDAEERKAELLDQNEMDGLMFKMKNDPRITKVGKFIRKTSIDELPQFWNVLRGDMSLIGTRPPTVDEYKNYQYYHKRRLSSKPGITGLWQVSGRSDITDFDDVVKLDLEYIDNWSIWMDIKILFKTIKVIIRRKGAA